MNRALGLVIQTLARVGFPFGVKEAASTPKTIAAESNRPTVIIDMANADEYTVRALQALQIINRTDIPLIRLHDIQSKK